MEKIDHEDELTNRRNEGVQFEEYWNVNEAGGEGERRKEEKRKQLNLTFKEYVEGAANKKGV